MTVSPWLTFESIKELQSSVDALPALNGVSVTTTIFDASATGSGSVALSSAGASGSRSIAIGNLCFAVGSRDIAIGDQALAEGGFGVAIGEDAAISPGNGSSVAIGSNSAVNASGAIQLGQGTNNVADTIQFKNVPLANGTGLIIPGPFANDTAAAGGGVGIGNPYYTATGAMQVRLV